MSDVITVTIPETMAEFIEIFQRMEHTDLDLSAFIEMTVQEYLERRGYRMPSGLFWIEPASDGGGDPTASIEHDRIVADAHE